MNTTQARNTLPFWSQLRWTLMFSFIGIAVLPVILVMGIALLRAREIASAQVFAQLSSISQLKQGQIGQWLSGAQTSLEQIVAGPAIQNQFLTFAKTPNDAEEFISVQTELNNLLDNIVNTNPVFEEIFFYGEDGKIIAASNPVQINKVVTLQPYFEPSLLGDYVQTPFYAVGSNELVIYITHALINPATDEIEAVLIGQLDISILGNIMTDRVGLGASGETYLVSLESNYFLTPSRFESDGYVQTRSYRSEGIDRALRGEQGFGYYDDYRSPGVPVLGVYDWIPELQAAILSEIDEAEGLVGYTETRNTYLLVALLGAILAGVGGIYTSNRISKPITNLTQVAVDIAKGNLNQTAEITTRNEIGILASTFNNMTAQLRDFLNSLERRVADRTKALVTSAEVSRRLSNILDPNQLVLQVVEQVKSAFNYYHAHIYLLDEATQMLRMAGGTGEVGQTLLERGHAIPLKRGLVGRAARTKSVVWVPETLKEEGWLPNPLLPETQSEIAVPIILGDKVLGVLDVQNNIANSLTQDDADLLQAIANQVAVGLQNARQYEQTQKMYQAGIALLSATDPQSMLQTFMQHAAPQADQAGLLLYQLSDEEKINYVEYSASWSRQIDFQPPIEVGARFSPEQIPFLAQINAGQPLIIANRETEALFPEDINILDQFGLQSLVGVPLSYAGKMTGALLFGYRESHHFTAEELQPVQTLSNQVVILLQNLALFEQTQATLTQMDILNRRLTGQGWAEFAKSSGNIVVQDVEPGLSEASSENGRHPSETSEADIQHELVVPIAVRGLEIGQFRLQNPDDQKQFSERDLELVQEVANEISVALENLRLIEQTQQNAAALEESRNLLNAVIDNLPLLLFVKDAKELRYVGWNKAGEEMLGISASEVLGKNAYDSFSKEEADRFTAQDWEILSGEKFLDIIEETVETPRGTRILHTRKTPVFGPDGQPRFLVGLSEDITERKQAEQALRDLESLYRRAIAAADAVPYARKYADETFTFIGDGIEILTGYTPEEFSASLFDAIIQETVITSQETLSREEAVNFARSGEISWKADYRILAKNGEERWLADTSVEILDAEGKSTGSVGILIDITEQKRNEATLNRQLLEIQSLNELGQILTSERDLDAMLVQAGQKICETFNVDTGYISLYDSYAGIVRIPFYLNSGEQVELEPLPLGQGMASHVIQTRQPLFISEMTEEIAEKLKAHLVGGILSASWLGVPILSGDEVIGVVSVQHNEQPNWFKQEDIQYLSTIASNLSTAIQNIRFYEQTQTAIAELEHLTRRLTRQAWQDYLSTTPQETGYVYDLTRIEPIVSEYPVNGDGVLEHPLIIQGEPVGRLVVAETDTGTHELEEIVSSVSRQLSAHIENLRLLEQTEQQRAEANELAQALENQREELDRQYKASVLLNSLLNMSLENVSLEEQLQNALDIIVSAPFLQSMGRGAIFLVEKDTNALVMKVNRNLDPQLLPICALVPFGQCHCGKAASTGQIQFSDCVDHRHENTYQGMKDHGHYNVPIQSEGKLLGVLVVYLEPGHQKDQWEMDLLQALSNTLASMIELKQTEGALAESTRQIESILGTAGEGIFGIDKDGNHTFVNPAAAQMLGYRADELIGSHSHSMWHHSHEDGSAYPGEECPIYFTLRDGTALNGDEYFWRKDGTGFPVAFTSTPLQEGDKIIGAVVTFRDVTEQKQTQEILTRRAAELQTVAEVGTASATLLNPDELLQTVVNLTKFSFGLYHAHIYLFNQANDMLVLSSGAGDIGMKMVLQGWQIPVSHEKSIVARCARTRTGVIVNDVRNETDYLPNPLLPDTRSELSVPLIVADEILGVLDVQAAQINKFSDDDVRIFTTLASQVAVALQNARLYVEQAATVQRLRELDHLKSSFMANMSHELRTPLNSIIGFTEIILEGIDGPLTEYMESDLKIIQKNGKHLLSLINDVLDMAKIEAGRMNLAYERFMLGELLDDVVDITSSLAQDKGLTLNIEGEDAYGIEMLADRIRLRQVMINVVGNAVKFTEKGGVTLRSERKNGKLYVFIKDTGIGIPPEKLESVFEAFSQVDTSTTRKAGGTGLGLPISRRLIELHQGRLWAESSGLPGEGSTFVLELPLEVSETVSS